MKIYRVLKFDIAGQLRFTIEEAEVIRETPNLYYIKDRPPASDYRKTIHKSEQWIAFSKQDALTYFIGAQMLKLGNLEAEKKGIEEIIKIASGMLNDGRENEG